MPPNPAAGKRPANARVGGYTRSDGTKVRSHTRAAQIARSKAAWVGLGFSSLSAAAIILEAGVTAASTVAIILIALLTGVAVLAGGYAERNKKKMNAQSRRRATTRTRGSTRTARRTTSRRRS